ncbi:MAG: nucleotidyltransferase domain-containing protein [Eubacterium sp.]|nr:nucleotidyltransferase domain-containing protein [Eubacterium sp.]
MTKQLKLFEKFVSDFKCDKSIEGVMLTGSVACGAETDFSDLDIIVLCGEDKFASSVIDGITAEIHYMTYEKALEKLNGSPMEVYRYLDGKLKYDNGNLQKLLDRAADIYNRYNIDSKEKNDIIYWLKSTKAKLEAALSGNNETLISYLVSINTWKVLEGIWAVNNIPIPPASSLYRRYKDLKVVPFDEWFEKLMTGNAESRAKTMIETISWILTH